ncbi:hypothetical protein MMC11_003036 [Xylographa trunciseda]|nr:hypothetical protein [Xylographa soralifera]MCJ1399833.1 hypothetical protein [Xylographa trunciseda]
MPLVVPGINSSLTGDNQQSQWLSKLAGKKLGDKHDETSFARQDLPKQHRVLEPGSMATQDFNKDRMNVHLGEDGTVKHVDFK